jgi:hypothetical protein
MPLTTGFLRDRRRSRQCTTYWKRFASAAATPRGRLLTVAFIHKNSGGNLEKPQRLPAALANPLSLMDQRRYLFTSAGSFLAANRGFSRTMNLLPEVGVEKCGARRNQTKNQTKEIIIISPTTATRAIRPDGVASSKPKREWYDTLSVVKLHRMGFRGMNNLWRRQ